MNTLELSRRLPRPDPGRLHGLSEAIVASALIATRTGGFTSAEVQEKLAGLVVGDAAIAAAQKAGLIVERDGLLHPVAGKGTDAHASSWLEAKKWLALQALGGNSPPSGSRRLRVDLGAVALRALYRLDNLSASPSRQAVRCELVWWIVSAGTTAWTVPPVRPSKAYKLDPLGRAVYLAFAGLEKGSVLQADAALLSNALGGSAETIDMLAGTVIRAALRAHDNAPPQEEAFRLEQFAESVKKLARRLETKPYSGRVAIAQVYDAGLAEGLSLGTLDDFKLHLANAAREGLLDLERYDITGPFDAGLKERSRLRFGRDERHFIVNQWI